MAEGQTLRFAAVVASLAMLVTACGGDNPAGPPRIRHESYANVFARVYEQSPAERYWSAITEAQARCENCAVTFRTSFRADSAADLVDAARLCNAMVDEIDKSGVKTSVTIEGTIRRAEVVADGSYRFRDKSDFRLSSGTTTGGQEAAPERCVVTGIMANTHSELRDLGWWDETDLFGSDRPTRKYLQDGQTMDDLKRTQDFFSSRGSENSRQLEDGSWAFFGRLLGY